jgi:pyrroline-5-carboxylate reductase
MKSRAKKVGFVGAGNMAGALIRGVLEARLYRAGELWVTDPLPAQRRKIRRSYGVDAAPDNRELVNDSEMIVLAVKPQALPQVLDEIRGAARARVLFVSIAAGFPLRRLEERLGAEERVVRVMPNTPALLGKGVSVLVAGSRATKADLRAALRVFRAVGDALTVADEALLDAVTGLSGSGPAYVYRFAEALIEAGVRQGVDPAIAGRLVFGTIEGAAAMLTGTKMTPKQLREMVSSPGGTTLAGLAALEGAGFMQAIAAAVGAATERSRELGGR